MGSMMNSITDTVKIHHLAIESFVFEGHGSTASRLAFDVDNRGGYGLVYDTRHNYLL